MALLRSVLELLAAKGWRAEWVDVTLNAQRPKLGALVPAFIENMNRALGGDETKKFFNMKVKSAEHCGSAGRGECMICHGVASIARSFRRARNAMIFIKSSYGGHVIMEKNSGKFVDYRGFTFDDVLLVPGYSEVVPPASTWRQS